MNGPAAGETSIAIVGASGMVGGYALRYALEHPAVSRVTAIGRRTLGVSHPKLHEVVHRDFADCSALAEPLSGQHAAVYCIGAYTGAVPDAVLREIPARQQPRRGVLILEREWRGPDGTKSRGLCTLQGRGRDGATGGGDPL